MWLNYRMDFQDEVGEAHHQLHLWVYICIIVNGGKLYINVSTKTCLFNEECCLKTVTNGILFTETNFRFRISREKCLEILYLFIMILIIVITIIIMNC